MPATRPTRTPRVALILLAAGMILMALGHSLPAAGAEPRPVDNGDASKTVTWTMNSTDGFAMEGLEVVDGHASLPWVPANVTWADPALFSREGVLDANLAASAEGIVLRSDPRNHVSSGDFATESPWTFDSGPGGHVTANWSNDGPNAVFRHSSAGTNLQWDSMDSTSEWLGVSPPGGAGIWTNATGQREGSGMLGLTVNLGSDPDGWAGILRVAPVNWSDSDRVLVWVLVLDANVTLSLNLTAYADETFRTTIAHPLGVGWQEVEVDLTELGPARDALASLTLRINGHDVPSTAVYFDDLRNGTAKRFDETAWARQSVTKTNETSAEVGSTVVRLNWSLPTARGVVEAVGQLIVTGPSGITTKTFEDLPGPGWRTFVADVSENTTATGSYELRVGFRVEVGNASESLVEARVDDLSFLVPNRHNGTYVSKAVSLGSASEFLQVNWSFDRPTDTVVEVALRSGNDSTPGGASWSPWTVWTESGSFAASQPPASFLQVRVDLKTTNASATPIFRALVVETRHRDPGPGAIISDAYQIPEDDAIKFLRWRSLLATSSGPLPARTAISLWIQNGSEWQPVGPGGDITWNTGQEIRWSARLTTTDGLFTPELEDVHLVYEYLGRVVGVELRWGEPSLVVPAEGLVVPAGSSVKLTAVALDAGGHPITKNPGFFDWTVSGGGGEMGQDGTFRAVSVGEYTITAAYIETNLWASVQVRVRPVDLVGEVIVPNAAYIGGALLTGVLGYAGYAFAVRRMFAIDDVFLISKDGRLLMHNTRRMRADRDEDILSGMFTAILAFLTDSDREENGDLRRFEIGGKTTLVERGAHAYLAAVYSGRVPRWAGKDLRRFMSGLEAKFGKAFAAWSGDPEDLQGLKEFTGRFVTRIRYRPPRHASGGAA